VSFEREGFFFIAIAALVAAGMYAAALNRRSWALWLIAFALTIVALWVAYFFRDPARARQAVAPSARESHQMIVSLQTSCRGAPEHQIVGRVALGIESYDRDGEQVQQRLCMERFRFGSRMSAVSPRSAAPRVRVGEMILAESTAFAELSQR
jgi:phosphatidylserine decarboxylase